MEQRGAKYVFLDLLCLLGANKTTTYYLLRRAKLWNCVSIYTDVFHSVVNWVQINVLLYNVVVTFLPYQLVAPWREAGDDWCHRPVWNLRAVIWFHFTISSLVLLPGPVTLSLPADQFSWLFFLPENSSIVFFKMLLVFFFFLWFLFNS